MAHLVRLGFQLQDGRSDVQEWSGLHMMGLE